MRKSALPASLLALTLTACGGRDNTPSLLDKPRILAVRAEPPQPSFGQKTELSTLLYQPPRDRLPARCSEADPTSATYHWEWCPIPMIADQEQNRFVCPFPEAQFQALYAALGLGLPPSFDLGATKDGVFTNPFPAPFLYALCRNDFASLGGGSPGAGSPNAGTDKTPFSCDLPATDLAGRAETPPASETHPISFNITVMVTVTPACPQLLPEGFSPLTATYSLHLPTQDAIPGNQNPVLSGIFVTANYDPPDAGTPPAPPGQDIGDGGISSDDGGVPAEADGGQPVAVDAGSGHDGPDGSVPLEDDPAITVKRDKHVGVQLDVDISTAEHLAVPGTIDYDSKAGLTRHYEHLAFSWYAEAGSFTGSGKGPNTGYLPTALPEGQDSPPSQTDNDNFAFNTTNTWDLPKTEDYSYATSRIIVVVRDGRGGVGWTSKQVRLEGTP